MDACADLERAMETARRAAQAGGEAALPYFRRDVAFEAKADGSIVTDADHAAERAILDVIREAFPDDEVLTEESGAHRGTTGSRWIVDPLDGTHRFARGVATWGPLIALERGGEIVAGALAMPARGETCWAARGLGAHRNGQPLRASTIDRWSEAIMSAGSLGRILNSPRAEGAIELIRTAEYVCSGGDLAGGAMVLRGEAEAWIEMGVQPWDIAPFKILIEEAGGRFTDITGGDDVSAGTAIVSNGFVHEHVLNVLKS